MPRGGGRKWHLMPIGKPLPFLPLRSGPRAASKPSRQKQIPSSPHVQSRTNQFISLFRGHDNSPSGAAGPQDFLLLGGALIQFDEALIEVDCICG